MKNNNIYDNNVCFVNYQINNNHLQYYVLHKNHHFFQVCI